MDGALAADRTGHRRDLGLVAVGSDADRLPARKIYPVEIGEKAMHEMRARLLAVAHNVDAGILLQLHGEHRRIELALGESRPIELPGGP